MKAGTMRQRVSVQRLSASVNAAGQIDETSEANWITFAERWANVVTRGSREFLRNPDMAADITHQVTMRSDPESRAFTVKNRLVMGGRVLSINSPPLDVDERGEMVRFSCVEVAVDG